MNTLTGHWFCSTCDEVVNIRKPSGRWDTKRGELCPKCRRDTADWIKDAPNYKEQFKALLNYDQNKPDDQEIGRTVGV